MRSAGRDGAEVEGALAGSGLGAGEVVVCEACGSGGAVVEAIEMVRGC